MTVKESRSYNYDYPEIFTWGHLDSPKLSSLANQLVNRINHSIRTDPNRIEVAGLRAALREIAEIAEV